MITHRSTASLAHAAPYVAVALFFCRLVLSEVGLIRVDAVDQVLVELRQNMNR